MSRISNHPLEHNAAERTYFTDQLPRTSTMAAAAYRRAVEALTGGLPTWAQRAKPGRKKELGPAPTSSAGM
ncbi:hypothetical protein ACI2VK_24135 [Ralstonia nicotianae]|nr:hypothetical protein [Ralstonia solanacearum]